jgi:hypothetical protein
MSEDCFDLHETDDQRRKDDREDLREEADVFEKVAHPYHTKTPRAGEQCDRPVQHVSSYLHMSMN